MHCFWGLEKNNEVANLCPLIPAKETKQNKQKVKQHV